MLYNLKLQVQQNDRDKSITAVTVDTLILTMQLIAGYLHRTFYILTGKMVMLIVVVFKIATSAHGQSVDMYCSMNSTWIISIILFIEI